MSEMDLRLLLRIAEGAVDAMDRQRLSVRDVDDEKLRRLAVWGVEDVDDEIRKVRRPTEHNLRDTDRIYEVNRRYVKDPRNTEEVRKAFNAELTRRGREEVAA